MVRNTRKSCLHFSHIDVTGYEMDPAGGEGINIVALNQRDHSVLLAKSYNTQHNEHASKDMINDMKGVRRGSVIIAAVRGGASEKLEGDVKTLFASFGSHAINELTPTDGWAFIGVKGQQNGVEKKGG